MGNKTTIMPCDKYSKCSVRHLPLKLDCRGEIIKDPSGIIKKIYYYCRDYNTEKVEFFICPTTENLDLIYKQTKLLEENLR